VDRRGASLAADAFTRYQPPAGAVGDAVAKLLDSAPEQEVREDLRRFKQALPCSCSPPSARWHRRRPSLG